HLGNRLAAKGALFQMRGHVLAAIDAAQLVPNRSGHCTHACSHHPLSRLDSRSLNRQGIACGRVNPGVENNAKQLDMGFTQSRACGWSTSARRTPCEVETGPGTTRTHVSNCLQWSLT